LHREYDDGSSLHKKIIEGVDILADNVASTLGPKGRNVLLREKGKPPFITKDGVTVSRFVKLEDPFMDAAAQVIKEASENTNTHAGDGTTTATVLSRAILKNAHKHLINDSSVVEIKRGIDKAAEAICTKLDDLASPVQTKDDIEHIAIISANNDAAIGTLISNAVESVGKDGSITIEEAGSLETSLELKEGFNFPGGYAAGAFINDGRRGTVIYEDSYVLVADAKIDRVDDILPVLEQVARVGKPLVIVATEVEGQALAALIMNTVRGTMKVAAVKISRYGAERRNIMSDLCLATGASYITKNAGLKLQDVKLEHLGSCSKIEISKHNTTIVDGARNHEQVEERLETLKAEFEQAKTFPECERIQERITRLAAGVAIIKVGAATQVEMIEKKHRVEDALEAVKAAQLEGIVPGGGVAFLRVLKDLEVNVDNQDQAIGAQCVADAIREPVRQMAKNAGLSPDIIESVVQNLEGNQGFDFGKETECDMIEAGIIDPVKVTKVALQNAASAAGTLIMTGYSILES
jgi:chaperonin GroEL